MEVTVMGFEQGLGVLQAEPLGHEDCRFDAIIRCLKGGARCLGIGVGPGCDDPYRARTQLGI